MRLPSPPMAPPAGDEQPEDAAVALVLEMTASFDADGFQQPSLVTRQEVADALAAAGGDVSAAVDEVLSLAAIRALRVDEQQRREQREGESRLQLHELCEGLGLSECNAFVRALEALPEAERDDVLSTNGGFIQQLLLAMDEQDMNNDDDSLDSGDNQKEDEHPLAALIAMFPSYRVEVIEDVLEKHKYDVQAAAEALHNLRAINHVQSFASVVSASTKAAQEQRELFENGPATESLGDFPALTSKTQQKKIKRVQRQRTQQMNQRQHAVAASQLNRRQQQHRGHGKGNRVNHWDASHEHHSATVPTPAEPEQIESGLASQLKIDRLHRLLPMIDRNVIQTTFFLNGGSSNATEASLREIFNVPLADRTIARPPTVEEIAEDESAAASAVAAAAAARQKASPRREWSTVNHRRRVDDSRKELSNRYCEMLNSFRRNRHAMAADHVRSLSKARQDLRDAQRDLAHDFFVAHQEHLKRAQPLDLHGMIVMEALQVVRESIDFCREHRIRRCLFICGVGHHSINGRPRILTAVRLSLERRAIDYRELHGIVTVFPLRSPTSG